jgi:hypothetical protein
MAEIKSARTTFRLTPLSVEFPGEDWIVSDISLRMDNKGQSIIWQSVPKSTIRPNDYQRLANGIRHFISHLVAVNSDNLFGEIEPFIFVPLELSFEFACLEGDLSPDGEGEVTIRVMINTMLNTDRTDESKQSEYVGSTFSIKNARLQRFLNDLEEEVDAVVQKQIEIAFA